MPIREVIRDVPSSARAAGTRKPSLRVAFVTLYVSTVPRSCAACPLAMLASGDVDVTNFSRTGHERS
jgi:hypothetical protein